VGCQRRMLTEADREEISRGIAEQFTDHHARLARIMLDQLDDLTARISEVTALLDAAITALPASSPSTDPAANTDPTQPPAPTPTSYANAVARLCAIPGAGPDSIRAVIGEIGLDMTVFGRHQRLCSWAKVSPRTLQSGRKKGRTKTGKGNPYLKAALAQIATGAAKTDTFLGERYRRLIKRMPKAKALVALQRSILTIVFHLLADPTAEFTDLGPDFYTHRLNHARRTNQLPRQLQALGYHVQLTPTKTA